ncbi:hypothetical protein OG625_21090 [Streptomyces sp. NBC_01351]|uniref:hypothetical protein n=1 Tax=Streptomyces sp. NBC_01351 TaxID=2903833 RepID=UPI002E36902C|nr:hypothetical protein [Streptomyces sp. NBC_01351]
MLGNSVRSWVRRHLTEFRLALVLVTVGGPAALAGAALKTFAGSGVPLLIVGLSALTTGLVMLGSGVQGARTH